MLRLRPFRAQDESAAIAAHAALEAEDFPFLLGYEVGEPWVDFVSRREANRHGQEVPERWVPNTFLAAVVDGQLVGRLSLRHELNEWLSVYGGHIGYGVVPWQRRLGYATEILRQGLVLARSVGIEDVLVVCDDDNVASAHVIERCGGVLESTIDSEDGQRLIRRYWIH